MQKLFIKEGDAKIYHAGVNFPVENSEVVYGIILNAAICDENFAAIIPFI